MSTEQPSSTLHANTALLELPKLEINILLVLVLNSKCCDLVPKLAKLMSVSWGLVTVVLVVAKPSTGGASLQPCFQHASHSYMFTNSPDMFLKLALF